MSEKTDAMLVAIALAGDKEAFSELVSRYQRVAVSVAMHFVSNQDVALELAQEAMLQAYLSLENLRESRRFRNWLYGIVLNLCRNYVRTTEASTETSASFEAWDNHYADSPMLVSREPVPHEVVQQNELQSLIREQIDTLSTKNRAATLLFYFSELSLDEIAEALGISVTAVKSRLHKSRKQLKAQLMPLLANDPDFVFEMDRRPTMIKVTTVRAVKSAGSENYILMLLDQPGRRVLPIWVGQTDGEQILLQLRQFSSSRPTTFRFVANLLATTDANLQEVRISALKYNVFHATVVNLNRKGMHEIDARPSDAIALALYMGNPIYLTEEVMASAGCDLPQAFDADSWQEIAPLSDEEMERVYGIICPQMFDIGEELARFTKLAQEVWKRAHEEAQRLNCNYVGTEHLLLAFVLHEESLAAQVLQAMGVKTNQVQTMVEQLVRRNLPMYMAVPAAEPIFVPRLTEVIHLAEEERRAWGHRFIGTEHLLLGLVREGKGAAAGILNELHVDMNQLRNKIIDHVTRAHMA